MVFIFETPSRNRNESALSHLNQVAFVVIISRHRVYKSFPSFGAANVGCSVLLAVDHEVLLADIPDASKKKPVLMRAGPPGTIPISS